MKFKELQCTYVRQTLTIGGLVLGAAAIVAAQAGVVWTAEALVIKHSEGAEANTRLVVKLAAVRHVAATHLTVRLFTGETWVNSWRSEKWKYNKWKDSDQKKPQKNP